MERITELQNETENGYMTFKLLKLMLLLAGEVISLQVYDKHLAAEGMDEVQAVQLNQLVLKILDIVVRHLLEQSDPDDIYKEFLDSSEYKIYTKSYEISEAQIQKLVTALAQALIMLVGDTL